MTRTLAAPGTDHLEIPQAEGDRLHEHREYDDQQVVPNGMREARVADCSPRSCPADELGERLQPVPLEQAVEGTWRIGMTTKTK
jgi:hypothetical protein